MVAVRRVRMVAVRRRRRRRRKVGVRRVGVRSVAVRSVAVRWRRRRRRRSSCGGARRIRPTVDSSFVAASERKATASRGAAGREAAPNVATINCHINAGRLARRRRRRRRRRRSEERGWWRTDAGWNATVRARTPHRINNRTRGVRPSTGILIGASEITSANDGPGPSPSRAVEPQVGIQSWVIKPSTSICLVDVHQSSTGNS
jgi:hypothetical protein